MMKILCRLGYHRWKMEHRLRQRNRSITSTRGVDRCTRCGKTCTWNSTTIRMEIAVQEKLGQAVGIPDPSDLRD